MSVISFEDCLFLVYDGVLSFSFSTFNYGKQVFFDEKKGQFLASYFVSWKYTGLNSWRSVAVIGAQKVVNPKIKEAVQHTGLLGQALIIFHRVKKSKKIGRLKSRSLLNYS